MSLDPRAIERFDPKLAPAAKAGELERRIAAMERELYRIAGMAGASSVRGKRKTLPGQTNFNSGGPWATALSFTFECSGVPVLVGWTGSGQPQTSGALQSAGAVDGAVALLPNPYHQSVGTNWTPIVGSGIVDPTPGTHTFALFVYSSAPVVAVQAQTQLWVLELSDDFDVS